MRVFSRCLPQRSPPPPPPTHCQIGDIICKLFRETTHWSRPFCSEGQQLKRSCVRVLMVRRFLVGGAGGMFGGQRWETCGGDPLVYVWKPGADRGPSILLPLVAVHHRRSCALQCVRGTASGYSQTETTRPLRTSHHRFTLDLKCATERIFGTRGGRSLAFRCDPPPV